MWSDWEEFAEALEGKFGEEDQEAALSFAEESGLLDQWVADEEAEEAGGYDDALEQEFQRVEAQVGRRLTEAEEQSMLDSISSQEQAEGFVPNLTAEYGAELANARNHQAGREHLGASAAQEVFDQQAADDGRRQASFEPPQPAGGDYGSEDD